MLPFGRCFEELDLIVIHKKGSRCIPSIFLIKRRPLSKLLTGLFLMYVFSFPFLTHELEEVIRHLFLFLIYGYCVSIIGLLYHIDCRCDLLYGSHKSAAVLQYSQLLKPVLTPASSLSRLSLVYRIGTALYINTGVRLHF